MDRGFGVLLDRFVPRPHIYKGGGGTAEVNEVSVLVTTPGLTVGVFDATAAGEVRLVAGGPWPVVVVTGYHRLAFVEALTAFPAFACGTSDVSIRLAPPLVVFTTVSSMTPPRT